MLTGLVTETVPSRHAELSHLHPVAPIMQPGPTPGLVDVTKLPLWPVSHDWLLRVGMMHAKGKVMFPALRADLRIVIYRA
jgi:hypothetical protein